MDITTATRVFGRCSEINKLIDMLLDTSNPSMSDADNISVVSIVGRRGVGKTTVAQSVYCNRKVERHFDRKAWICFSQPFQLRISMVDIADSFPMEISKCGNGLHDLMDLAQISETLCKVLTGNKFLIVLDSVWDERNWKDMRPYWVVLYTIFQVAKEGSKILIATSSQDFTDYLNARGGTIILECLKDEVFWELFRSCAFGDAKSESENLECIGREIAKKLGGLPLAAKVIGGLLRSRIEENYWRDVLENNLWQNEETEGILTSLRLSYEFLPQHLKPCFLYCSLFPEDHRFEKDTLVHYWMALDYIAPCDEGKKIPEDVGRDYFTELEHRSFFQKITLETSTTEFYAVHSLLHDVAKFFAGDVIYTYGYDILVQPRIPNEVCHLYLGSTDWINALRQICQVKKLQSLVIYPPYSNIESTDTLKDLEAIFRALSNLRILIFLVVEDDTTSALTECIDSMLQLRYLQVPGETECDKPWGNLCHLQVFKTADVKCKSDAIHFGNSAAEGFAKLNNLRHLYMNIYFFSPGIGLLTSLQELRVFRVKKYSGRMNQLKHLNQLRGSLRIEDLENVRDEKEAKEAMLENKEYLDKLVLCWSPGDNDEHATIERNENVLQGLQPHSHLKELEIKNYGCPMAPSWISETKLPNIERIELFKCRIMKVFPPLGELPFLRVLRLIKLDLLEYIGNEVYGKADKAFPMLEELVLVRLLQLTEWSEPKGGKTMMPRLRILEILECEKLKLPIPFALDSPLGEFKVGLFSPQLDGISLLTIYIPVNYELSGLQILSIGPISKVERFTDDENQWFRGLASLEELRFTECYFLESLPAALRSLPSLKRLHIDKCYRIHFQQEELPACLEELNIDNCPYVLEPNQKYN